MRNPIFIKHYQSPPYAPRLAALAQYPPVVSKFSGTSQSPPRRAPQRHRKIQPDTPPFQYECLSLHSYDQKNIHTYSAHGPAASRRNNKCGRTCMQIHFRRNRPDMCAGPDRLRQNQICSTACRGNQQDSQHNGRQARHQWSGNHFRRLQAGLQGNGHRDRQGPFRIRRHSVPSHGHS